MTKSTNVFFRILDAAILVLVTFLYLATSNSGGYALVSTAIFGVIAYRQHYLAVVLDALIVLLTVIIISLSNIYIDLLSVIINTLSLCLTGSIVGLMLKNQQKHFSIIVAISLSELLITILSLLTIKREGKDIFETLIASPIEMYSKYALQIIEQSGAYSADNIRATNEMINALISSIATLMPAIIIIISVISTYFSYVFTKKVIEFITKEKISIQSFSELKMSNKAGFASFIFVILSLLIPSSVVSDAILNIIIIFFFAYFACGISIIDFYFKKTKIWWWVRLIIYMIVITLASVFISILPLSLILIAMFDARQDIRKLDAPDIIIEIKDDDNES